MISSMAADSNSQAAAITSMGVLSHWLYFIHGEHHLKGPLYFQAFLISLFTSLCVQKYFLGMSTRGACIATFLYTCYYSLGLYSSIVIYRLFFHRTRRFPGPKLVVVSKLWHSWLVRNSQNHLVLQRWQEQYGDFVRTGPNEITVFHPEALHALNDYRSDCSKSEWYDIIQPHVSINSTRDKSEHDRRRRVWNPSFTDQILSEYDLIYSNHLRRLEDLLRSRQGEPNEMRSLWYWWSFDVMGELMFSKSLQTLTHEHSRWALRTLRRFMAFIGPCSPSPWVINLGSTFPGVFWGWKNMIDMCDGYMKERIDSKTPSSDIASKVVEHSRANNTLVQDGHALGGDSIAMAIAGSDTLACTLVYALTWLAREPRHQNTILAELGSYGMTTSPTAAQVQNLPYLNAFVNETLRLNGPVPTGLPRMTGSRGLTIAGEYLPPYTTIVAPRWNIARQANCFSNPRAFSPNRWLNSVEGDSQVHPSDGTSQSHDTRAFLPFGFGRHTCVAKALSLRQLRATVAYLVTKFEIELAEGEDGLEVDRDMRDEFTAYPGKIFLQFKDRMSEV